MTTRRKLRPGTRGKVDDMEFEVGSGNVFADLELENPDERLAKARLAAEIDAIIQKHGWTQEEAAARLKTHQPIISALRHGRLKSLSYDRLVHWLVMLGRTVEIHALAERYRIAGMCEPARQAAESLAARRARRQLGARAGAPAHALSVTRWSLCGPSRR